MKSALLLLGYLCGSLALPVSAPLNWEMANYAINQFNRGNDVGLLTSSKEMIEKAMLKQFSEFEKEFKTIGDGIRVELFNWDKHRDENGKFIAVKPKPGFNVMKWTKDYLPIKLEDGIAYETLWSLWPLTNYQIGRLIKKHYKESDAVFNFWKDQSEVLASLGIYRYHVISKKRINKDP